MNGMKTIVAWICCLVVATGVYADMVVLTNGDRLTGKLVSKSEKLVVFKSALAGEVKILWKDVAELNTEEPVAVIREGKALVEEVVVFKRGETETVGDDDLINPGGKVILDGWHLSGLANVSLQIQQGNSDRNDTDLDTTLTLRRDRNRFTFFGEMEVDEKEEESPNEKWLAKLDYNRFVNDEFYGLALATSESDDYAALTLRSTTAVGFGYQPLDRPTLSLLMELNGARVFEDVEGEPLDEYWAAGWNVKFLQSYFERFLTFYLNQSGIWNLDDTDRALLTLWTGFRVPLRAGLVGTLELRGQHDFDPPEGIEETDVTYSLKLGYQW
jgi:putative salt-induced outer membrane protein YdiY